VSDATWASAVERYRRGVARYQSTVGIMPDRTLRRELLQLAVPLEAALEDFEDAFANRRRVSTDHAIEVLAQVHQAATLSAHATEAALMANEAAWRYDDEDVVRCVDTVRSLIKKIDELGDGASPGSL
jgi:hypothetical protein